MPDTKSQILFLIIAVIVVLLFLGILFLSMILFYGRKRRQNEKARQALVAEYEKQALQARLEIQETAFNYISGELHDNVGQLLSFAKIQLARLGQHTTAHTPLLAEAAESLDKATTELRDLARGLSSDRHAGFLLFPAIEEELRRMEKGGFVNIVFHRRGTEPPLPAPHKLMLFRVVQEALHNILRHAAATTLTFTLTAGEGGLEIDISDNGQGFNLEEKSNTGLGLRNMIKRVSLVGGACRIQTAPAMGTRITITVHYA